MHEERHLVYDVQIRVGSQHRQKIRRVNLLKWLRELKEESFFAHVDCPPGPASTHYLHDALRRCGGAACRFMTL